MRLIGRCCRCRLAPLRPLAPLRCRELATAAAVSGRPRAQPPRTRPRPQRSRLGLSARRRRTARRRSAATGGSRLRDRLGTGSGSATSAVRLGGGSARRLERVWRRLTGSGTGSSRAGSAARLAARLIGLGTRLGRWLGSGAARRRTARRVGSSWQPARPAGAGQARPMAPLSRSSRLERFGRRPGCVGDRLRRTASSGGDWRDRRWQPADGCHVQDAGRKEHRGRRARCRCCAQGRP